MFIECLYLINSSIFIVHVSYFNDNSLILLAYNH